MNMNRWSFYFKEYLDCSIPKQLARMIYGKLLETKKTYDSLSMAGAIACDGEYLLELPIDKALKMLENRRFIIIRRTMSGTEFWLNERK